MNKAKGFCLYIMLLKTFLDLQRPWRLTESAFKFASMASIRPIGRKNFGVYNYYLYGFLQSFWHGWATNATMWPIQIKNTGPFFPRYFAVLAEHAFKAAIGSMQELLASGTFILKLSLLLSLCIRNNKMFIDLSGLKSIWFRVNWTFFCNPTFQIK